MAWYSNAIMKTDNGGKMQSFHDRDWHKWGSIDYDQAESAAHVAFFHDRARNSKIVGVKTVWADNAGQAWNKIEGLLNQ